jgi:hypothetical protein
MEMLTRETREARLKALTRLALATREKVEPSVYVIYLEDTAAFSTGVMTEACQRLERSSAWFPKVAELIEECRLVAQQQQERREQAERQKRIMPPPPRPEFMADVMQRLRQLARKKSMR